MSLRSNGAGALIGVTEMNAKRSAGHSLDHTFMDRMKILLYFLRAQLGAATTNLDHSLDDRIAA